MSPRLFRTSGPASVAVAALLLAGCQAPLSTSGAEAAVARFPAIAPTSGVTSALAAAGKASADDQVDRVLAISVDGLSSRAITQLGAARTPAIHRLMREGAATLNARTEWEGTSTLPNHTGMLSGRRVDRRHGGHGVTFNSDAGTRTVHRAAGRYVASAFDVVHDRGGSTALYTSKAKFALFSRSWNTHGALDRVGRDNGRAKIDRFTVDTNNARLVGSLTAELSRSPRQFTFLHLSLPDETGHRYGFMSPQYLAAVRQVDGLLGRILSTITARPDLRRHTLVVLTADHGGAGTSHGDPRKLQNYRIPFMAWGPGVAAGHNLYRLNPSYRSPGSKRGDYRGRQPIRNGDLANLVTDALDLPPVPGAQFDRQHSLTVFR